MRGGSRRYFVVPSLALALAGLNGAEHCTPRSMLAVACHDVVVDFGGEKAEVQGRFTVALVGGALLP